MVHLATLVDSHQGRRRLEKHNYNIMDIHSQLGDKQCKMIGHMSNNEVMITPSIFIARLPHTCSTNPEYPS